MESMSSASRDSIVTSGIRLASKLPAALVVLVGGTGDIAKPIACEISLSTELAESTARLPGVGDSSDDPHAFTICGLTPLSSCLAGGYGEPTNPQLRDVAALPAGSLLTVATTGELQPTGGVALRSSWLRGPKLFLDVGVVNFETLNTISSSTFTLAMFVATVLELERFVCCKRRYT